MSWVRRLICLPVLLAVLFNSVAPALAASAAPAARPPPQAQTCPCRAGGQARAKCCCEHSAPGQGCGAARLPCDGGTGPEAAPVFRTHPLDLPRQSVPLAVPPATRTPFVAVPADLRDAPLDPT